MNGRGHVQGPGRPARTVQRQGPIDGYRRTRPQGPRWHNMGEAGRRRNISGSAGKKGGDNVNTTFATCTCVYTPVYRVYIQHVCI